MQKQAESITVAPLAPAPRKQKPPPMPRTLPPVPKKLTGQDLVLRLRRWGAVAGITVQGRKVVYGLDFVALKQQYHIEAPPEPGGNEGRAWSRLLEAAYVQLRALEEV